MKSAYELAMERLEKESPAEKPLNEEQKQALARVDEDYQAKLAEREVFLAGKRDAARAAGNHQEAEELEAERRSERERLEAEREEAKERIRRGEG